MVVTADAGIAGAVNPAVSGAALDSAEGIVATIKWFRPDKGYGFLDPHDGGGDAFLHAKVLRAWRGREAVAQGATARVVLEDGPRGRQVARVIDVDESTASAPLRRISRAIAPRIDLSASTEVTGKVKWFDDVRGFGFVAGDDFGRDVFVHCSIFGRTHVTNLVEGQAVTMRVIESAKGREAVEIAPIATPYA